MSNSVDVNALLNGAVDEGTLGANALNILTGIDDIGNRIQAGLGTPADAITASEVILVKVLCDDSPSMRGTPATAAMGGYGLVIDSLKNSKQKSGILFGADLMNGGVLCAYTPLEQAVRLDASNYRLTGMTPFFDRSLDVLATVLVKAQEFSDNGVPARSITLLITDGYDNASRAKAAHVATVVKDLLKAENHIVAAMGICESTQDPVEQKRREQEFRKVFTEMGIPDNWVLTPQNSDSEIRKAFAVFSNSVVRASQNTTQTFSKVAVGGFGN